MVSTSSCAKTDEVDLIGHLSPIIGVGDEEDTIAELLEWPRLKGSRVGSRQFREFRKAKSSINGLWGHAFGYRGNFFRTYSVSQGGDYLYLLPNLAKEKKCRRLGDKVPLEYVQGMVKDSRTDGFCCYLAQFDYGLMLPLSNLAKSVMNMIGGCPAQLNCNFWEVILVCETLNERWAPSGSERRITAKDFLEYYAVKYVTVTDVSRKESFIDVVAREGTELEDVLKELEISRFKRVASKDDKVRRSQAKRRMAAKNSGSIEEKLSTPELNTPLKLTSVDDSNKRRKVTSPTKLQVVLEKSDKIAEVADLRPRFEVEAGLLEEQCRVKARDKIVVVMDDEFKKPVRALRGVQLGFLDRSIELEKRTSQLEGEKNQLEKNLTRVREAFQLELEKEREVAALKLKEVRAESVAEAERLVTASATSQNNLAGKLYQLRYTKAEIMAFSEGNYEEKEIMDEEKVEEMGDGLNEIESSCLRVMDLEGLLEVEKKSSAELMFVYVQSVLRSKLVMVGRPMRISYFELAGICTKELDVVREREEQTLLYNAEYAEEYEALISQYEDQLDDNVKLSLKLEEAKRQVEDKTAIILSRDSALNQLTSELVELKEKAASGSRYEVELAKYRIRALNEEISDMKCNIRAMNEQLLKREIDLDTARTNLAMSVADFEKLSSSIVGKD
ncbi:hypothetical protein GIB67_040020 [Kingdonia uniflora]|uniref:Uncharacterized protein n=1 Tax=Kingdonia uniflora TaxID=39325 RepID=A0A7J7MUE0_9MAGN|nr:hypothetical protein GIB67_040020 [Kingdonia uniflora]